MARKTETNADYYITTNATLLRAEIADFMDEHRFTVYVSIDGDKEVHDRIRVYGDGRGSFADVERNVASLRAKPRIHLIGSAVICNGLSLKEAMDKLAAHGVRQCKAERVRVPPEEPLALAGEEHDAYLKDIEGLVAHSVEHLSNGQKPLDYRLSSKILQVLTRTRRDFFCPAGQRMFGISASGEIYPCALHVGRLESHLGSVDDGLDPRRQEAFCLSFSPQQQNACSTCWARHLCGGGCSAMVDRFGHDDCRSLRAESEAAIAVYQHFADRELVELYGLISPAVARWAKGESENAAESEAADARTDLRRGSRS